MKLTTIELKNETKFVKDYKAFEPEIDRFFTYNPYQEESYKRRLEHLDKQAYQREALREVLLQMNQEWGMPKSSAEEINRLLAPDSVVVIGGQQAGLLGGPLYSVNKVITIIKEARRQEKKLNRPVVPMFWIAGEDHDYEEINHVHIEVDGAYKKIKTSQQNPLGKSISDLSLTDQTKVDWFNQVVQTLPETMYTKEIIESLEEIINKSTTFIEFFARTIYFLFPEEGIVLVDSGATELRNLETSYFVNIIEKNEQLSHSVEVALTELKELYEVSLEAESEDLHLFYRMDTGERVLLQKTESGLIIDKNEQIKFTQEELIKVAEKTPDRLSNNVVTRPLMQEMLFPTLAFIGGYGEINYWATLKGAFSSLGLQMPPVLPRYSITYLNPKTLKNSSAYHLDLAYLIEHGTSLAKQKFLQANETAPIDLMIQTLKQDIATMHGPLQEVAKELGKDTHALTKVNLKKIHHEMSF